MPTTSSAGSLQANLAAKLTVIFSDLTPASAPAPIKADLIATAIATEVDAYLNAVVTAGNIVIPAGAVTVGSALASAPSVLPIPVTIS